MLACYIWPLRLPSVLYPGSHLAFWGTRWSHLREGYQRLEPSHISFSYRGSIDQNILPEGCSVDFHPYYGLLRGFFHRFDSIQYLSRQIPRSSLPSHTPFRREVKQSFQHTNHTRSQVFPSLENKLAGQFIVAILHVEPKTCLVPPHRTCVYIRRPPFQPSVSEISISVAHDSAWHNRYTPHHRSRLAISIQSVQTRCLSLLLTRSHLPSSFSAHFAARRAFISPSRLISIPRLASSRYIHVPILQDISCTPWFLSSTSITLVPRSGSYGPYEVAYLAINTMIDIYLEHGRLYAPVSLFHVKPDNRGREHLGLGFPWGSPPFHVQGVRPGWSTTDAQVHTWTHRV